MQLKIYYIEVRNEAYYRTVLLLKQFARFFFVLTKSYKYNLPSASHLTNICVEKCYTFRLFLPNITSLLILNNYVGIHSADRHKNKNMQRNCMLLSYHSVLLTSS